MLSSADSMRADFSQEHWECTTDEMVSFAGVSVVVSII